MSFDIDVRDEYAQLGTFYDETAALLSRSADDLFGVNAAVSGWAPAGHLYHVWLANGRSLKAVSLMAQGALPLTETGAPNAAGRQVLGEERFPRGQQEAPEATRPRGDLDDAALKETLRRSRATYDALEPHLEAVAVTTGRYAHPVLGMLNGPQWLRFVRVHSAHHQAIIRDILSTNG